MSSVWCAANGCVCLLFLFAAAAQWNDPDPYVWMPLYGVASALAGYVATCPTSPLSGPSRGWWLVACFSELIYCLTVASLTLYAAADRLNVVLGQPFVHEEGRELAGVACAIAWLLLVMPAGKGTRSGSTHATRATTAGVLLLAALPAALWTACWTRLGAAALPYCEALCRIPVPTTMLSTESSGADSSSGGS